MSRNKAMHVRGYTAWTLDNSHDILLATLTEVVQEAPAGVVSAEQLEHWRVWSSIADLALSIPNERPDSEYSALAQAFSRAVAIVRKHGDYTRENLLDWYVLDDEDHPVSGGFLRYSPYPAAAVTELGEGIVQMLLGIYPMPENGAAIKLGYPA